MRMTTYSVFLHVKIWRNLSAAAYGSYSSVHARKHGWMRKMILGSDSHTRYGALGTMAVGEGGGELVKQLLEQTWDAEYPEVIAVYLDGKPNPGIGPQDIAIAVVSAVFKNGYVKIKLWNL